MTMCFEKKLRDFTFWSGAATNARYFKPEELDQLEDQLEELKAGDEEPWTTTEINDLMWFQMEDICEWLGLDYEEVMSRDPDNLYGDDEDD